jgi:hypothetical protein
MHNKHPSALELFRTGQRWIDEKSTDRHVLTKSQFLLPGQRLGFVNPADCRKTFMIHHNIGSLSNRKASLKQLGGRKDVGRVI